MLATMTCRSCQTENRPDAKFCSGCGVPLERGCPSCGAPVQPSQRFCDECGSPLTGAGALPGSRPDPLAERRLVSVVFADLVGFTTLAESRDAEEVRELLSRYFDACRRLVERYGGIVEKFIGDAVMAVWGTPTANEDDAERAVRTALDLVAAVSGLGDELGAPALRLRAGVLTGEAAVTVGAEGQGMVAGDLVNSAARIQAVAEPGTVLVGETTRRATEAAVAFEDVGLHDVKGKAEPIRLYRALRVIAARRGEGRSAGLEPPFVGRRREFGLVKDLFHACAEERRARVVSITAVAGIGKSRLSWEFEKYVDGLVDDVRWHRGRCLAYGDGVAYWALYEMVRMRARIVDDDPPETALAKLRESLAGIVTDPDERVFLEPRLAHLLGLAERSAPDKEDLFSAWRLFFERMAEHDPVVLVFEDLQWADAALLDFIEYLLDWSRSFPIYVLTLSRPELAERRPAWGAGRRGFTSLFLEPLEPGEIDALLSGLAPGLPEELRGRIVERAEGVPLYAVETVRMLLDRGLLERSGDEYRPTGPIVTLAVPETLQALAAARLDGLDAAERRLLGDAAVLGKTFTRQGLAALSGLREGELEPLVQSLLRKEILGIQADPLSPERGQLSFLQDLLRRVAYETLSLRERKARHLAAAAHLEREWETEEEVAAVLAAHYLDAYRAGQRDPDAPELKARARAALARAGERAISLAAAGEAAHYFAEAAELTEDSLERAELLQRAGQAAAQDGDMARAHAAFDAAIALLEEVGERHAAARVSARKADAMLFEGRVDEALALMRSAYDALAGGEPDADLALVAAQLARLAYFAGEPEAALEPVELAIDNAEALALPEALAEALNTKAMLLWKRPHESEALLLEALKVALANELPVAVLRAQFNLSGRAIEYDRLGEARGFLEDGLALARRRGDPGWEANILGQLGEVLVALGEWDEALARLSEAPDDAGPFQTMVVLTPRLHMAVARGQLAEAEALLVQFADVRSSTDRQSQANYLLAEAMVNRAAGRPREALAAAETAIEHWRALLQFHYVIEAFVEAVEAALELEDEARAEALLTDFEQLPRIQRRPLLEAQELRLRAKLLARRGEAGADERFAEAAAAFRRLAMPLRLAVTLLEHGESCLAAGRPGDAAPLVVEARQIFERLGASSWLERIDSPAVLAAS